MIEQATLPLDPLAPGVPSSGAPSGFSGQLGWLDVLDQLRPGRPIADGDGDAPVAPSTTSGLETALSAARRAAERGEPVLLGPRAAAPAAHTAVDPYHPDGHSTGLVRSFLAGVLQAQARTTWQAQEAGLEDCGVELHLATRWPQVVEDLDLLHRLDASSVVTVDLVVPCLEEGLARRIENGRPARSGPDAAASRPLPPPPEERLEALARVAATGIATRVVVRPLMSYINSDEDVLRPLFEAAREAGAIDVVAAPLTLGHRSPDGDATEDRARFFPWLRREFPELTPWYKRLYGHRDDLGPGQRERLLATFRRLRLEHGFPRGVPGRG